MLSDSNPPLFGLLPSILVLSLTTDTAYNDSSTLFALPLLYCLISCMPSPTQVLNPFFFFFCFFSLGLMPSLELQRAEMAQRTLFLPSSARLNVNGSIFFVNWGWRWNVCKTVTQRKSYMEREGEVFGAVHSEKLVQMYSKLLQYKQPALKVPFHWALKTLPSNAANSLIKRNPAQSRKSFL